MQERELFTSVIINNIKDSSERYIIVQKLYIQYSNNNEIEITPGNVRQTLPVVSSSLPPSPSPSQQHEKNTFSPFNANAFTPAQQDAQYTSVALLNPELQSPFNALTSSQASSPFSENSYCNIPLFNPFTSSQTLSTFSGNSHYCNPPSISPFMFEYEDPSFVQIYKIR
ncbi:9722_t:CDS:2 [Racocetra fulgida]|uniref:9722_t:CDS:1 n=1 Tax=Racocetra fulgida TaxID=60492 RepID=A0A9N9BXQ4_9GLOM|nr:9722_t:CDS:2 [Racocetra fulgida]